MKRWMPYSKRVTATQKHVNANHNSIGQIYEHISGNDEWRPHWPCTGHEQVQRPGGKEKINCGHCQYFENLFYISHEGEERYLLQLGETRDKSGQSNEEMMVRLRMMFRSSNLENVFLDRMIIVIWYLKMFDKPDQNCRRAEGKDMGVGHLNKVFWPQKKKRWINSYILPFHFRNNLVFYGLKEENLCANNAEWMVKEVREDLTIRLGFDQIFLFAKHL